LIVSESTSASLLSTYRRDQHVLAWWATVVECVSAISKSERDGRLTSSAAAEAIERLERLKPWSEIQPTEVVQRTAQRLLRVHSLRSADALQLAAAIAGSEGNPKSLAFVCLDSRLAAAARKEGFSVTGA
jgi:hypothetical protein